MKYIIFFFFLISIFGFGQQIDKVDFIKCNVLVNLKFEDKSISGNVFYQFKVISKIDTIRIDARNMQFEQILINNKPVKYNYNLKQLLLFEGYNIGKNSIKISYNAHPKQAMYFTGTQENYQIFTQGQGKYTSNWLPSFDDVNEKVIFNFTIKFDPLYEVIANGKLLFNEVGFKNNQRIWIYNMKNPMSSYLAVLAIGKFEHKTEKSSSGIPLENFYKPQDLDKFQYTFQDSKAIFDFLENEIGVKYPWEVYRQVPIEDFLYAGMENTSTTLFAQDFVVDESGFNDRNYINVNAHELAHQWFGDLVTAKSGKHHWLQEGFATYYALLAERKLFGDDYFYYQMYKNAEQIKFASKTDTVPIMNEKASSLSFYQKGAWALHTIRETIGAKKFNKAVKNYLEKYKFKNVETDDFLAEIRKVSDFDTESFKKTWLEDYHFPTEQANSLLKKSDFYRKLSDINSFKNIPFSEKESLFIDIMKSDVYFQLKKEIIYQVADVPFEQKQKLIHLALKTNDFEVRQAVGETINTIPLSFKSDYELLLDDKSYDTKQIAFLNLYKNFPEERGVYLAKAENWVGKNDKELRIIYLTVYQVFKDADADKKAKYYQELVDYSSPKYESSVRQNALENVLQITPKDVTVLKNLVNATTHHKWQFVKYARDKIRELIKEASYQELFNSLLPKLNKDEQYQLLRLLNK